VPFPPGKVDPSSEARGDAARPVTDGEALAASLAGDSDAFEVLVRRYQSALFRTAFGRLGRRDWAEDAVQETFYCAFKSLSSYNSLYSFRTWLWTILLNQCRRQYQKERRRPEDGSSGESPTGPAGQESFSALGPALACPRPLPLADVMAREQTERLALLLAELPESQADAVRLRFHGGLTFPEIAASLGCSLSSAKNWVRLGLLAIGERLPKESGVGVAPVGEKQ
jgi:RNA polymerase sigma-70 factor (ECF subfamily)